LNSGGNSYNAFPENQLIKKYYGDGTTSPGGGTPKTVVECHSG